MATTAELVRSRTKPHPSQCHSSPTEAQVEWMKLVRRQFSPPGTLKADGDIDQEYFKPKKIVVLDDKKWGAEERELLYKGLADYGVGKWRQIGTELLPRWDDQALRIKASRLIGSQSLARYIGWKGNRAAVEEEFRKNKEIGERTGCWKAGLLVEDASGSVKKVLEEISQKGS